MSSVGCRVSGFTITPNSETIGVMELWSNALRSMLHYSNIPLFHHSTSSIDDKPNSS